MSRILLPGLTQTIELQETAPAEAGPARNAPERLVHDLLLTLWTAQRFPEERFFSFEQVAGSQPDSLVGAVRAAGDSALSYALTIPLSGRLVAGAEVAGDGEIDFRIVIKKDGMEHEIAAERVQAGERPFWFGLPLDEWAGQDVTLTLATEALAGEPEALWLRPQILAYHDVWLLDELPPEATPQSYRFGEHVELIGYEISPANPVPGQPATVSLFWRAEAPTNAAPKVFVHVLNEAGEIVAQHDAQPVMNSYAADLWEPGQIVADMHPLIWPEDAGDYRIAVGLYDPATLERWPVHDEAGNRQPDDRLLIPLMPEQSGFPNGLAHLRLAALWGAR
jgi:hypothetical protein